MNAFRLSLSRTWSWSAIRSFPRLAVSSPCQTDMDSTCLQDIFHQHSTLQVSTSSTATLHPAILPPPMPPIQGPTAAQSIVTPRRQRGKWRNCRKRPSRSVPKAFFQQIWMLLMNQLGPSPVWMNSQEPGIPSPESAKPRN